MSLQSIPVGKRPARCPLYHSGAAGIDITRRSPVTLALTRRATAAPSELIPVKLAFPQLVLRHC